MAKYSMGPDGLKVNGVPTIGSGGLLQFTGKHFYVDYVNGSDGNKGTDRNKPLKTLYKAHSLMKSGKNDVCNVIGDGAATGTVRLSKALAQEVDSTATTGVLAWTKDACHIVGECSPTMVGQRARIAPPTGTYTAATFGSANFITVSGNGCLFANLSVYHGFSTGGTNQICWTDSGSRNAYLNVNLQGMADAASAQNTGSRTIKFSGGGEHTLIDCALGLDTVTRTVANSTVEFSGGTTRISFLDCIFPFYGSAATLLAFKVAAASGIDRWILMDRCKFMNAAGSGSTTITALATMAASAGGLLHFKDCSLVGFTGFGSDATTRGQIYIEGGTPAAATTGLAVAPTA